MLRATHRGTLAALFALIFFLLPSCGPGYDLPPEKEPGAPEAPGAPAKKSRRPPAARRKEREAMVDGFGSYFRRWDTAVLAAMRTVPRHEFVPKKWSRLAYVDHALPIGYGQTISQPRLVAKMTQLLRLTSKSKVLEVGTGSGYQAAVLAELTEHVYSVEIIKVLAEAAARRLKRLGYSSVRVRRADGYNGWKEEAPFDAIIVTCAAGQVPPPLIKQLAPGGRLLIPVGARFSIQSLILIEKDDEGEVTSRSLMPVRFVPLLREDRTAE